MLIVRWTPDAIADVQEAWDHIAADNEPAAERTADRLEAAAQRLTSFPRMGRVIRRPAARQLVVAGTPYKLVYRILTDEIEILRVLHGAQDWPPKG